MMMICKGDLLLDLGQHGPGDKMKLTRWATHKHKIQQIQTQIQHGPSDKMKLTRWATHKYQAGKYHCHNVIRNVWRNRKHLSFGVYFFTSYGFGRTWKPLVYFKILSLRFWYRQSSISTKNLYNFACVCVFDVLMDGFFRRKSINEGGRFYQQSETSQVVPQHQHDHLHHHHHHHDHHHYQHQHHQHLHHHYHQHLHLVVNDTQSDSIQYLYFAKKWFIQYSIQYCFTQDSIQNIIQFKINSGDSIKNIIQFIKILLIQFKR